jgi:hypothetical protein
LPETVLAYIAVADLQSRPEVEWAPGVEIEAIDRIIPHHMLYSEDFQAACMQATWRAIRNCEEASGGVLWSWADYYHRRSFVQYAVFGPYGAVTVDRRPKAALTTLTRMYGGEEDK